MKGIHSNTSSPASESVATMKSLPVTPIAGCEFRPETLTASERSPSPSSASHSIRVQFSAGNIALLLLFFSACFHSLAKYFYSYYKLLFGTLYPCYASYKAIKNKNVKEYARWMMFWVVFGLFCFFEVFADIIFTFWLPFYHEIKILFILWLCSPYGNGARILYKNIIHPELNRREAVIDSYVERVREIGWQSLANIWSKSADVLNIAILSTIQMSHAVILTHMERISASHSQVFPPIPSSSQSTPLSLPLLASRSMYAAAFCDHATEERESNDETIRAVDEDMLFFDSDVSSVASSSNVPLDDVSDDWRPVSPARRPSTLKLSQQPKSPTIMPKHASPKRSLSPQTPSKKVKHVNASQIDPEKLGRVRQMRFVRPPIS